jgi:tetratricopeptide (TPR) repeat protein
MEEFRAFYAIFRALVSVRRLLLVLVAAAALVAAAVWIRTSRPNPAPEARVDPTTRAEYVGAARCRDCHDAEYKAWETSHHRQAMQIADARTVLGDFNVAAFKYGAVTSAFSRRDGAFRVRTDAATGSVQDFDVKYTFGVAPLQQYLIELPGGRLQALSIAWDSRPKAAGGQRWFHLYPGDGVDHTDELHWTGRQQNWNFMCADCHSTNLRRGYDAVSDRFQTTWSELNVACEACHGPGSIHAASSGRATLPVSLSERRGVQWSIDPATLLPKRSAPRTTSIEIDICAQCHSRREQIGEGYAAGAPLEDHYAPSLITPGLYYPDGQQRDEVYTYGSFLQSRMAHTGVTCADCHEPHSGRPRAEGNALCAQCHTPAKYDSAAHHFHAPKSPGALCVSCHMPATTYMQVDARRDHSIRVPRPDRSVAMGVPNACSQCHANRTAAWADQQLRARLGRPAGGFQTFAETFHAAESGHGSTRIDTESQPGSADALRRIAGDPSQPTIVRASALARLAANPDRGALDAAAAHLTHAEPMMRRAALSIFEAVPPEMRTASVAPLLRDAIRSVRLQAAWLLAPVAASLTGENLAAFTRAADELVASLRDRANRPEERTTLGTFLAQLGRRDEATAEYRAAIRLAPRYTPPYVNLSDLQRQAGAEADAERTLREGIAALRQDVRRPRLSAPAAGLSAPAPAPLHHALGLSLARSGRRAEAIEELKRAAELSDEPRFIYTYAVALNDAERTGEAIATLERAVARHPLDRDILFALATFHRDAGRIARALEYAEQLLKLYPGDSEAASLVNSLRASRRSP